MKLCKLSHDELIKQSPVKITRWIDVDGIESKEIDDDRQFTKKILLIGEEDGFLSIDAQGCIWGLDEKRDRYYPFYIECGKDLLGFCLPKKALN